MVNVCGYRISSARVVADVKLNRLNVINVGERFEYNGMTLQRSNNPPPRRSEKTHSAPAGKGAQLRSRFQRILWGGIFLGFYLVTWIQISNGIEEPGETNGIWILLCGAFISFILGSVLSPVIPRLLGYHPRHHRTARKSGRQSR